MKRRLRRLAILLLISFSNPWLSSHALAWLENDRPEQIGTHKYAVVLGGLTDLRLTDGMPEFNEASDRLLIALSLYYQGKVNKLILSGGSGDLLNQDQKEAYVLHDYLESIGFPDKDLILESASRNTYENAREVKELLDSNDSVLLITSAYHMSRAERCFLKQGISVTPFPVDYRAHHPTGFEGFIPSIAAFDDWHLVAKELTGLFMYRLMGYN